MWQLHTHIHRKWTLDIPQNRRVLQVIGNGEEFACIAVDTSAESVPMMYIHLAKHECGPFHEILFIDFSPIDQKLIFAVREHDACSLWIAGRCVQIFQSIQQIYFLPDGNLFLETVQKNKHYIHLLEKKLRFGPFEHIIECLTTPESDVVVVGVKGKKLCHVIINDTEIGSFNEVPHILYNQLSHSVFFIGETKSSYAFYHKGKLQKGFSHFQLLTVPDVYTAPVVLFYKKNNKYIFDGHSLTGPWDEVRNISANNKNIAFIAISQQNTYVITPQHQLGPFDDVRHLRLYSDSGDVTYIATQDSKDAVFHDKTLLVQAPDIDNYWLSSYLTMVAFSFQYNNEFYVQCNASIIGPLSSVKEVLFTSQSPHIIVNGTLHEQPYFFSIDSLGEVFHAVGKADFTDHGELIAELIKEEYMYIWYKRQQIGPFTSILQRHITGVKKPFYITRRDDNVYIVYNNVIYGYLQEIETPVFNNYGEPACAMLREDGWYVFNELKQLGPFIRIAKCFWGPGNILLIVGQTNQGWYIFAGNAVHGPFQGVGRVLFSPLTMALGASVTVNNTISIYLNGQYYGVHGAIWSWGFSQDNTTHIIYSYDEITGLNKEYICVNDKHVVGSQVDKKYGGGYIYFEENTVYLLRFNNMYSLANLEELYNKLLNELPEHIIKRL